VKLYNSHRIASFSEEVGIQPVLSIILRRVLGSVNLNPMDGVDDSILLGLDSCQIRIRKQNRKGAINHGGSKGVQV
jgi:hypothetical protein